MTSLYNITDNSIQEQPEMEIWKDIPNYEGFYQVSNWGSVKSLQRTIVRDKVGAIAFPEKILKLEFKARYLYARLRKGGVNRGLRVHRLVAIAFIPNPENKPQVNHKNKNKLDNRAVNLEWCTGKENSAHFYMGYEYKKKLSKPRNVPKKLRAEDIFELAQYLKGTGSVRAFARLKGVSHSSVIEILSGKVWRHIPIDWSVLVKARKQLRNSKQIHHY